MRKKSTIPNTVAVNDMLHEDFKERVREKYGYDSNDEESDYESDEDIRATNRMIFRLKKAEELRKEIKCDICDFTMKSEVGLKSHKTKKHKEQKHKEKKIKVLPSRPRCTLIIFMGPHGIIICAA